MGMIMSLIFPLINILRYTPEITIIQSLPTVYLPEITVRSSGDIASSTININYWQVVLGVYSMVTILLFIKFIISNYKLIRFINKNEVEYYNEYPLIKTEGRYPTFAYLKYIFWDNSIPLNKKEQLLILKHEETHIKEYHSVDILSMEILKIIFWFHPAIYIIDAALRTQHEFIADKKANDLTNDASYRQLMVRSLFEELSLSVGHGFQFSTVKTRIKMLKKQRSAQWKRVFSILSLVSILGSIVILQSCVDNEVRAMNDALKDIQVKSLYGFNFGDKTYWDVHGTIFSHNLKEETTTISSDQINADYIVSVHVIKDRSKMPDIFKGKVDDIILMSFEDELEAPIISEIQKLPYTNRDLDAEKEFAMKTKEVSSSSDDDVFEVVENPASAPNGMKAFYDDLGKNIIYPNDAKRKDVEGKVYVQFVVNKEGVAEDVKVVRGFDPTFDKVAVDAVAKTVTNWNPATQRGQVVKQRMVLPVVFKL
ncbi:hypothetical protein NH26_06965 [Flammeovirga pacifica]|uniref:TonB C-terminal domain-containing protein n=2 Tax=Flammeovirga pacifica TaxID=915059 RepID=A0A1S1YYM8_FLAPC|nr:hypothetical protein NH26_06965 [Flammeovirga pacifica]